MASPANAGDIRATAASRPSDLRTGRRVDPIGLDSARPEFSWGPGDLAQQWYELEVADSAGEKVWTSGRVTGERPFGVPYEGPALRAKTRYVWKVRVGDDGRASDWSDPATFETGLQDEDWSAIWITDDQPTDSRRTLYFRGAATLPPQVVRARAYATALGWYRLFVNGTDITGHALVPRWTPLDQYVEYQVYDITDALRAGENVFDVIVADGRYRGRNGFQSRGAVFGDRLATLVQIEAELADGTSVTLGSDTTWTVGAGPVRTADHKHGERVDLRLAYQPGISLPLDACPAVELAHHDRRLIGEEVERVGEVGRLPGRITKTPQGVILVDFAQNFAGVARVRLSGAPGTMVRLSYSEVLTPDGELDVHYLDLFGRSKEWFQRDEVTLGETAADYTPWFTVHGFRYLAIEPLTDDEAFRVEDVEGIVLSTPLRSTATFASSDERLNRLWSNVEWSLRSNFLDTATDCPTRERSGWTGDIQIFGPTASVMVDADPYLRRYLRNLAAEQFPDGGVPTVIPREWSQFSGGKDQQYAFRSAAGWGDTAVMLPWTVHTYYDDPEILRRQYPSMRAWVENIARIAAESSGLVRRFGRRAGRLERYVVDTGMHFGEWLRPGENMITQMIRNKIRPPAEVATAYFAHSCHLLARIAQQLDHASDAERYGELAEHARSAYRAAFVREGGARIGAGRQDDYVRALAFGLLEPAEQDRAATRLAALIEDNGGHLATGFLSTPMLLSVLVEVGRSDLAYRVLLQSSPPSWLHQIERGATTIWETWEGHDRKGAARMSHNHYAFGSVAGWLFEHVVGIRPLEPGYRRFAVAPTPGGGLTSAGGTLETGYGTIAASWHVTDATTVLEVTVPPGTQAEVHHEGDVRRLGAGTHRL
ncbi:family 78 glycoside hydrolase catalytic domain [Nonomuraea sp. NPDC052129]|uniref:family 78 glycoside hydrolase catalytic domain n=1 Tax=Nonomuraea sp. NPDC052129 TaxID=3154651 RepID=UPI0034152736